MLLINWFEILKINIKFEVLGFKDYWWNFEVLLGFGI